MGIKKYKPEGALDPDVEKSWKLGAGKNYAAIIEIAKNDAAQSGKPVYVYSNAWGDYIIDKGYPGSMTEHTIVHPDGSLETK